VFNIFLCLAVLYEKRLLHNGLQKPPHGFTQLHRIGQTDCVSLGGFLWSGGRRSLYDWI